MELDAGLGGPITAMTTETIVEFAAAIKELAEKFKGGAFELGAGIGASDSDAVNLTYVTQGFLTVVLDDDPKLAYLAGAIAERRGFFNETIEVVS